MAPTTRSRTRSLLLRWPDSAPPLGLARTTTTTTTITIAPAIQIGPARTALIDDIWRHRPRDAFAGALVRRQLERQTVRPPREKIARLERENDDLRHDWLVGLEHRTWADKHAGEADWAEEHGAKDTDADVEAWFSSWQAADDFRSSEERWRLTTSAQDRGAFDGRDRMQAERDLWVKKFKKERKKARKLYVEKRVLEAKVAALEDAAKQSREGGSGVRACERGRGGGAVEMTA
ncbi:MAG: hypothetical protein Q9207_001050 [Kuettlingeria erythrocarpa]